MVNKLKSLLGALAIGACALLPQSVSATIDNLSLYIYDTNSVNSALGASAMNIRHKVGAHEGYYAFGEDAIGPAAPYGTEDYWLKINTLVDGNSLGTDARPTNSVSTFTAYLSCIDTFGAGGIAFPQLQFSWVTRDSNVNYQVVIIVPAANTVSGQIYSNSFLLSNIGTNIYLPQINVRDASLNGYYTSTGSQVGYYGTVDATPIVIPEPSSLLLTGAAMVALLGKRMRQGMKSMFSRKGKNNNLEEKVD
jgi:hypothetical protein